MNIMEENDKRLSIIGEVMEEPEQHRCQYEYLPDEDGTVYRCDSQGYLINQYNNVYFCKEHALAYGYLNHDFQVSDSPFMD